MRRWSAVRLVAESTAMLAAVRLALTCVGLTRLRAMWLPRGLVPAPDTPRQASRVVRAVGLAAHVVPFASCLTQAQAAQILLARHGIASTVCIGVRETEPGRLAAHAWLMAGDRLILGGRPGEIGQYRQLAALAPVR